MKKLRSAASPLFVATVLVPTALSVIYFGVVANDVYVSESSFIVRSPDKQQATSLGALLKGASLSGATEEAYAAENYMKSRDALSAINRNGAFERAYSRSDISLVDRFNPLGFQGAFEDLYEYFTHKIVIDHDTTTAITTLRVKAYTPADAQAFNQALLDMAEHTVNAMNDRARRDLIGYAANEVSAAKRSATAAAVALSNYRNRNGVLDPEKQAGIQLQMVSKLQDQLIADRTQLAELKRFAPRNPQVQSLEMRVESLSNQIDEELGKVAGSKKSLAASAAEYQRLFLESQVADKQLAATMASLEVAKNEAERKQAYVERIVQPSRPDSALEPRRVRGVLVTLLMGLVAWGISVMLLAGIREHKD